MRRKILARIVEVLQDEERHASEGYSSLGFADISSRFEMLVGYGRQ